MQKAKKALAKALQNQKKKCSKEMKNETQLPECIFCCKEKVLIYVLCSLVEKLAMLILPVMIVKVSNGFEE